MQIKNKALLLLNYVETYQTTCYMPCRDRMNRDPHPKTVREKSAGKAQV